MPEPCASRSVSAEYAPILDSIRIRSSDSGDSMSRGRDATTVIANLESDLKLSATVGSALLEDKAALEAQLKSYQELNESLKDDLARSGFENAQLQRRLEDTVDSLEQSDSSNRSLLVSLEEDRKTISRLSLDITRMTASSSQFAQTKRMLEDSQQEFDLEKRKLAMAEAKIRKQTQRIADLEQRLKRATGDLEELRQQKVLRSRKSHEALAKVRARLSERTSSNVAFGALAEHPDAADMLKLIGNLVQENEVLKSESAELTELLNRSRDETNDMPDYSNGPVLAKEATASQTYVSEQLLSPSSSKMQSDFDGRPRSPLDISSGTGFTRSWGPSSDLFAAARHERKLSSSTSSIQIPFGGRASRHSLSVDVGPFGRNRLENGSLPASPMVGSPPSLAASVADSENEEPIKRKRRAHRPLSLSLGTPLFPKVPEDDVGETSERQLFGRRLSYTPASTNRPSGLTLTSPPKRKRGDDHDPGRWTHVGVQTSPVQRADQDPSSWAPASPTRTVSSTQDSSSRFEFSSVLNMSSFGGSTTNSSRTTSSLQKLIDHNARLLHRLNSADVVTTEARLKRQNLSGDARHLALAYLKDIQRDVENMRSHFRKLMDQDKMMDEALFSSQGSNANEAYAARRDFFSLVKLFRDLLLEAIRMRGLLNRLVLDPSLAGSLRELDKVGAPFEAQADTKASTSGGLLAPISKLISSALSSSTSDAAEAKNAASNGVPGVAKRPIGKLTGSSAVSSATVNVEFAPSKGAAVRRAINSGATSATKGSETNDEVPLEDAMRTLRPKRSEAQVRKELSSIFVGKMMPTSATTSGHQTASENQRPQDWVVVPTVRTNAFGRLLASYTAYLPGMSSGSSSVANAVIDAAPQNTHEHHHVGGGGGVHPSLLERQLRPRGLSDSSIRSTFVAHGLSSEPPAEPMASGHSMAIPITITSVSPARPATHDNTRVLSASIRGPGSLRRQASIARLKSKPSLAKLSSASQGSEDAVPPVPALPVDVLISSTNDTTPSAVLAKSLPSSTTNTTASSSLLANISKSISTGSGARSVDEQRTVRKDREEARVK